MQFFAKDWAVVCLERARITDREETSAQMGQAHAVARPKKRGGRALYCYLSLCHDCGRARLRPSVNHSYHLMNIDQIAGLAYNQMFAVSTLSVRFITPSLIHNMFIACTCSGTVTTVNKKPKPDTA